jgi:hypothetical protein
MELILNLLNQLPANQIAKIKKEFTENYIADQVIFVSIFIS